MAKHALLNRIGGVCAKITYQFLWKALSLVARPPDIREVYRYAPPETSELESVVYECTGDLYIEPEAGYIITKSGYVLEDSMRPNFAFVQRPFRITVPSPFRFFHAVRHGNTIAAPAVASLRHFWEWNYYHFFVDALGKLSLLEEAGVDEQLPLVVAKYMDDLPFARQATQRGALKQRSWINPRDKYVKADRIIYCRTQASKGRRVAAINRYIQRETKEEAQKSGAPTTEKERRIFLNRTNSRRLANLPEVQGLLERNGFEIVDTAGMTLDEQITLFASVRHLIALHGAGTTNIIFRQPEPMSVLELHHERLMNYDHKKLCEEFGYYWDSLEGVMCVGEGFTTDPKHGDFTVSPLLLEAKIKDLLSS